ncbi:N-acetyl-alpha-D-glucosaminyl L-malate synthase BshA [Anoxybacter fermentans]|uniref:N-acetyl-alpha-D-glucosaminyl L-malate synthase BshA n=1 Tax=Anoxybacter fermentans TaxID=1323375 RepID=A0A3Q9HNQ6_9FIRM|nr:N-acetyl-alpha-D-glucosaminyl L-malate synthase BshA [Anoxybacter fermentans]AZR72238.1 N-acetyl-alpha-D-glucosaminyl L-malate synthase BshA [Anoxybacter fermentans]
MRIGIVCYPSHGGSGVVATELGKQLARRGHKVHFISYNLPFRLDKFYDNIYYHEVDTPTYPLFKYPPYSLALTNKIAELIRYEKLDVIHAHYAIPHSLCAIIARDIAKAPELRLVTTLHGTDITLVGNDPSYRELTKYSIEETDGVTAVSKALWKETIDIFDIKKRIEVIYNFVDVKEYTRQSVPEVDIASGKKQIKNIIHISNFRKVKNIPNVIKIFHLISQEVDARLLLVGGGPEECVAKRMVQQLQLEDKVLFLGKQDNIVPLLSISDLLLLPSKKESFGLVCIEAMACKVPVIASNTGGLPEVVEDGVTGFLADPDDYQKMAELSLRLLQNSGLHEEFAERGRRRVVEKFNAEKIVDQYEKYYRSL